MFDLQDSQKFFIKKFCKLCYQKGVYNLLNFDNKCVNSNCIGSSPMYANAKKPEEFVRDFQNDNKKNLAVVKCRFEIDPGDKFRHISACTFSHNDYEYWMWEEMKTIKIFKIADIFKKYVEPYIYMPHKEKHLICSKAPPIPNRPDTAFTVNANIPNSPIENDILQKEEKNKIYFCWFCLKDVTSEQNIPRHIEGKQHQANYKADKMRRWYFKMPSRKNDDVCKDDKCQCILPHSEDERLEMNARIKYREFMASFELGIEEPKISHWPKLAELQIPKFPSNINCYKNPIQIFTSLSIKDYRYQNLHILLCDNESRPYFKLIKTKDNQDLEKFGQILKIILSPDDLKSKIEFGIEFSPLYSSTYRQRILFRFFNDSKESKDTKYITFCKHIRVDVGRDEHLKEFRESWIRYRNLVIREQNYKCYLPFNMEENIYNGIENICPFGSSGIVKYDNIMNINLISNVLKVIPNTNWLNEKLCNYNYCYWMEDMMVLEELEMRSVLSKLKFEGKMKMLNSLTLNDRFAPANDGKLYGLINFKEHHDLPARDIIIKNVNSCYVIFNESPLKDFLFECEIVDLFRYKMESRSVESVTLCLSKRTVDTMALKNNSEINVQVYFCFNRETFDRRHRSLKNIPKYDKLSYNPLSCPYFTRIPYGEDESKIKFKPFKQLNENQKQLPKLVLRKLNANEIPLPFVLNGAFGTGKSVVFAETVMTILRTSPRSYILICVRSYSAGEIYVNVFKEQIPHLFQKVKLIKSIHKKDEKRDNSIVFSDEINEDLFKANNVFITTLTNAVDALSPFNEYFKNHSLFKYIFVDEAAQVLEIDAIMVYQFGYTETKFIFAGDVLQTRPELVNTRLKKFSIPIVSRLYNLYKSYPDYTICLKQVYRTHPKIVKYLSDAIYCSIGLESLMKPVHRTLKPMKFIDTKSRYPNNIGTYFQNYSSYKNDLEIELIVDETINLVKNFNVENQSSILVCTPFYAQVKLIRDQLRKKGKNDVVVEQPSNIQGKEFEFVLISTVLTDDIENFVPVMHPTFHSSKRLINLVVSRAKHFVEVIGDKSSLTGSADTGEQWQRFIDMCKEDEHNYGV